MGEAAISFLLLMAVVMKSMREHGGRVRPSSATQSAIVAMMLVETSVSARAALFPALSPTAGLLLDAGSACHRDSVEMQRALKNRTLWAERMVDASARIVVGGLWGAHFQLGSFDGCLSAGATSPVGARYCLAELTAAGAVAVAPFPLSEPTLPSLHPDHRHCDVLAERGWDHVSRLYHHHDALHVLQGCGMLQGSIPPGDVLVALCVPEACGAASLEAALSASLQRKTTFQVRVTEKHCVGHAELRDARLGVAGTFFWVVFAVLSAVVVLAPRSGGALSAWDMRRNLRALVQPDAPLAGMDLTSLSGMRGINMILLVGAHRGFSTPRMATSNQYLHTTESRTSMWHSVGHNAQLMVETCFFMAGLLMSLSISSARQRHHSALRTIANRYIRLTPSLALVMLFYASTMESLGSGPLWKSVTEPEAAACRRWWWTNLLYVNNYVSGELGEYSCMLHTWSLAVDMQQFALATVLLTLPLSLRVRGAAAAVALLLPFAATLANGWPPMMAWTARMLRNPFAEPLFHSKYVPTHLRAGAYVVGVAAGFAMLKLKERRLSLGLCATRCLTWGSLAAMLALMVSNVLFGDLGQPASSPLVSALYATLCPVAWTVALGFLVVALTFGQRTAVLSLLRWQPLQTLSRLSYGVFLVHFMVHLIQGAAERNPQHITVFTLVRSSFSDLEMSLVISLWLYLAVEAPMRHLAKAALSSSSARATPRGDREDGPAPVPDKLEKPPLPAAADAKQGLRIVGKVSCF